MNGTKEKNNNLKKDWVTLPKDIKKLGYKDRKHERTAKSHDNITITI